MKKEEKLKKINTIIGVNKMIKTTKEQKCKIMKAIKSDNIYGNEAVWNFLISSILSNPLSQKKYFQFFCNDSVPITSIYDIWFESQPVSPRKDKQGHTEGRTRLDIAFGSITSRQKIGSKQLSKSGIQYDHQNEDEWICFIEGKFDSELSKRTAHDSSKNQLTRVIENALCFQGKGYFPKKLYVTMLTPKAYHNNLNKNYYKKFKEYKKKPGVIIKDIESSQIKQRPSMKDWNYPNLEERIKWLTLNWISYEDIIRREYNIPDLDLTDLNDMQKEFFSDKLNKIVNSL